MTFASTVQPGLWLEPEREILGPGACVLRRFAATHETILLEAVANIAAAAPFRRLMTPGGHVMSVAMTNAGALGWISDRRGYRYEAVDPMTGHTWPAIPRPLLELAASAADCAGFAYPPPDACLVNRYEPGARLSLHQDLNERGLTHPIVSISLGLTATFLFGGLRRGDRPRRVDLESGDVVVFGGLSRMAFHGVAPLRPGLHDAAGPWRYNLTLRHAG